MTLSITVDGQTVTGTASNLQIKSTVNGFASVSFNLNRKLEDSLLASFLDVLVYDTSTGEQVGGGRLMEQGRTDDGTWQITCLGEGLASMGDRNTPGGYIDQDLANWQMLTRSTKRMDCSTTVNPGATGDTKVMMLDLVEDKGLVNGQALSMINRLPNKLGLRLASIGYRTQSGVTVGSGSGLRSRLYAGTLAAPLGTLLSNAGWATSLSARLVFTTPGDFTAARDVAVIQWACDIPTYSGASVGENHWSLAVDPIIRFQLLGADRVVRTSGYSAEYVKVEEIFTDWLARYCPRLDIENAAVATGTHQFTQLVYMDGTDGASLMDDVLAVEPEMSWAVWEKNDTGRWTTELKTLPTTVRYEASVDDGFDAPSPSTAIYNRATVTGRDASGNYQRYVETRSVPALDDLGLTRESSTGIEAGAFTAAAADAAADAYLSNHRVPPNAGTLTIARPIFDSVTGRWVKPHAIRPGELVRVRGVQPSPDTLNATSPDGVTVFRVVSMTYSDDTGAAVLELDSMKLTQTRATALAYQVATGVKRKFIALDWAKRFLS